MHLPTILHILTYTFLPIRYRPSYMTNRHPEIARSLTEGECEKASKLLAESGVYSD
ncbi:MAG: hypothetical protein U9N36_09165 [Euryarchaeota archaeon]|nr:hypothetical protein [Euryarchaeota archaeon]